MTNLLSVIGEVDTAATIFRDTVSLIWRRETPWGKDIVLAQSHAERFTNVEFDPSFDKALELPEAVGLVRRLGPGLMAQSDYPINHGRRWIFSFESYKPLDVFGGTATKQGDKIIFATNMGKGMGSQIIPERELLSLVNVMDEMLTPFVKYDAYLKKVGSTEADARAVATDVFLEANGHPDFLDTFGNPMAVPPFIRMRTRSGRGSKPSYFRLQDAPVIIETLRKVA